MMKKIINDPFAVVDEMLEGIILAHGSKLRLVGDDKRAIIRADAPGAGLRIADAWMYTGPPWQGKYASDDFHPNDTGYRDWCAAFAEAIGLDGS